MKTTLFSRDVYSKCCFFVFLYQCPIRSSAQCTHGSADADALVSPFKIKNQIVFLFVLHLFLYQAKRTHLNNQKRSRVYINKIFLIAAVAAAALGITATQKPSQSNRNEFVILGGFEFFV